MQSLKGCIYKLIEDIIGHFVSKPMYWDFEPESRGWKPSILIGLDDNGVVLWKAKLTYSNYLYFYVKKSFKKLNPGESQVS